MFQFYLAAAVLLVCLYFKHRLSFWYRLNVEGPSPLPIFGNLFEYIVTKKKHFGEIFKDIYDSYPAARYVGIYRMQVPAVLVRDLDLIKDILVTSFNTFNMNEFSIDPELDPLVAVNPFCIPGEEWKTKRHQLSPLFAQNRTKIAIPYINDVSKRLIEYMEGGPESTTMEFDVKELCAKFTTDNVAAVAFGIDGESFTNPNAAFRRIGDEIFKPTFFIGLKQQMVLFMPFLNRFFRIPFVPKESDHEFRRIVGQVVEDREKSKVKRDDLLQVILDLREKHGKAEWDDTAVAGNGMTFLTEGYETSSTTMSMTLYELALNPEMQRRAQLEVDQLLALNTEINENVISGLDFVECCVMEAVRLHCPVFHMAKVSLREHEFPPQYESSTKTVMMPAGTVVVIPVYALHLDKAYFPDPYKYDPDRWSKENKDAIPKFAFLGFSDGPRICLGMKFGVTQVKAGLAAILSKYNVLPTAKTDVPFRFSKSTFNLQPEDCIWLKFEKRTDVAREE